MRVPHRLKIAVIGTGISGLGAAWLLNGNHDVTVYEKSDRVGGHSNTVTATVDGRNIPVDTGFIVFNRPAYPNLSTLFELLKVPTQFSDMAFSVSLDGGMWEYGSSGLAALFGQKFNLLRPRFWAMLVDLLRFYRRAPRDPVLADDPEMSLGDYLAKKRFGAAFRDDHLLPMASAIWSAAPSDMLAYPAAAFIRFYDNHGLLQIQQRPLWETVVGGSRAYVERLIAPFRDRIRLNCGVREVQRQGDHVLVTDCEGRAERFNHVVLACHADQALAILVDAIPNEQSLLAAFRYSRNLAMLHTDASFMPKRRAVWSSWNYCGPRGATSPGVNVTYWMNRLQTIKSAPPLFVTLNPPHGPHAGALLHSEMYEHPVFNTKTIAAQRRLWSLQGAGNVWFCGAYFGAGFHEDGLQAGLAVAEQLGGMRRPWKVPHESGRIVLEARRPANALNPSTI
jgi:predicted NAD/FAD-binding protein